MDLIIFIRVICAFLAFVLLASDVLGLVDPLKNRLQQLQKQRNELLVILGVSTLSWGLVGILINILERKKDKDSREILDQLSSQIKIKDEIVLFFQLFIIGNVVRFFDVFLKISSQLGIKRGMAVFGIIFGVIAIVI